LRFFEEAHIKDVLAYLKVIHNPRDEISWQRVLKLLDRIGPRTAEKIFQQINKTAAPLDEIVSERVRPLIPSGGERPFRHFQQLIRDLVEKQTSPAEMIKLVVESDYADFIKNQYSNYQERLEDLEQLGSYALKYNILEDLLSALALVSGIEAETVTGGEAQETEACVLSTVHQAKGLEWKVVFVIWLADGRFPSYLSFNKEEEMEEERRLFYVAVTRAKDELYLTYPIIYSGYDGEVLMKVSRYLEDLPAQLYEKWDVEEEGITGQQKGENGYNIDDYQQIYIKDRKSDFEAIDISQLDFLR
jgi:DNA helicase-2/ATP-dependent DNA helicase PcrA